MYAKAQLFIPRSVQGATDSDFVSTDLSAGESAVVYLSSDNKLASYKVDTTSPASDTSDLTANMHNKFQVMWRKYNTSDVILTTPELSLAELVDVKVMTSDAGTKQVTTVTPTVASSGAVGDIYDITIVNTTPGTADLIKKTISAYNSDGSDFAVSDLLVLWTSDINAVSDVTKVTASEDGSELTLTGTTYTDHFRVAVDGEGTAEISYDTDLEPPTGSYEQIVEFERNMKSHGEGITNSLWFPRPWTSEVENSTYLTGVFKFKLNKPAKHGMNAINTEDYTLYIAEEGEGINLSNWLKAAWNAAK